MSKYLYVFMKQKTSYTLFYKRSIFLDQPQYAYGFSNLCMQYAWINE